MGHVVSSDEAAAQHIPAARDASRFSHASLAHVRARTRSTDTGLPHTSPRVRAQADTGATAVYFRPSSVARGARLPGPKIDEKCAPTIPHAKSI